MAVRLPYQPSIVANKNANFESVFFLSLHFTFNISIVDCLLFAIYLQHLHCRLSSVCYNNRKNSHDNEPFYVSIHLAHTVLPVNAPLSLSLLFHNPTNRFAS